MSCKSSQCHKPFGSQVISLSGTFWVIILVLSGQWRSGPAKEHKQIMAIIANNHSSQTALRTLILQLCQLDTWVCVLGSQVQTIKGNFRELIPSFPRTAFDKPLGIWPKLVAHENPGRVYHRGLFSCSNISQLHRIMVYWECRNDLFLSYSDFSSITAEH